MKFSRFYQLGMLGLLGASAVATVVACSDDDDDPVRNDAGADATVEAGGDSGRTDSGTDAGPTGSIVINLAHAMPNIDAVKLCFKVGTSFPLDQPLPEDAPKGTGALPPAAGGALPIPSNFLGALAGVAITPVVVKAEVAARFTTCSALTAAGSDAGADNIWELPPIPAGTLKLNGSYLIVLHGCAKDDPGGAAKCGAGYTGASTVTQTTLTLDGVSKGAGTYGFQFLHASAEANAYVNSVFGSPQVQAQLREGDGGETGTTFTTTNIGSLTSYQATPAPTPATAVSSTTALSNPEVNGVTLAQQDGGPTPIFLNFNTLAYASSGAFDAGSTYFKAGGNYALIAIGNPAAPGTLHAFRIIALPTTLPTTP